MFWDLKSRCHESVTKIVFENLLGCILNVSFRLGENPRAKIVRACNERSSILLWTGKKGKQSTVGWVSIHTKLEIGNRSLNNNDTL